MRAARPVLLVFALGAAALGYFVTRGGASADSPAASGAAPKISFDRETHDFGIARQEHDLTTQFALKNIGGSTLHVSDPRADCGCSVPKIDRREIEPGGGATVAVVFHTLTFSGPMTKRIRLTTDDPNRKEIELYIKVDVSAGIVLEPPRFYFGNVLAGTSPTVTVGARWKDGIGRPFKLTGVEAPEREDLAFDVAPLEAPPWHGYSVTARWKTPPGIGTKSGTALLRTDDPDYPRIPVAITAFVSGKAWLSMREVAFGFVPYGKSRTIPVACHGYVETLDLGEVTVKSRKGRVQATAVRDSGRPREWTILVTLPEGTEPGKVEDVIELKTSIPDEPVTEIRVGGEVMPKPSGPPLPAPTAPK